MRCVSSGLPTTQLVPLLMRALLLSLRVCYSRRTALRDLEVSFLDRQLFPNGAVGRFWEVSDIQQAHPQASFLDEKSELVALAQRLF